MTVRSLYTSATFCTDVSTTCVECYHRNARGREPDPTTLRPVLVVHSHPSVLVAVEAFQADLAMAEQMINLDDTRGQLLVKRVKRNTHQLQRRLR